MVINECSLPALWRGGYGYTIPALCDIDAYELRTLPSGVYIYHITAEGLERGGKFQDAGKMVLLK